MNSTYGFPVMQTELQALEWSAAVVYNKEVFFMFCFVLKKASTVKVVDWKETTSTMIYVVSKYGEPSKIWHVSRCFESLELRCSCQRM